MARRRKADTETTDNTETTQGTTVTATAFDPSALVANIGVSDIDVVRTTTRDKYADNPFVDNVRSSYADAKTLGVDVVASQVGEVTSWLRDAARKADLGIQIRYRYVSVNDNGEESPVTIAQVRELPDFSEYDFPVHVAFRGKSARQVAQHDRAVCPECGEEKSLNRDNTLRAHKWGDIQCPGGGRAIVQDGDHENPSE